MSNDWWQDGRDAMLLDPGVINLNTGSFGPLSRPAFARVTELRAELAAEPMDFFLRRTPALLWQARSRLADFLGTVPHRLLFTANVTAAINLTAFSLRLASPGEVLLSDHEYAAMHWCWERAARRQGLTIRTFPLPAAPSSPGEVVQAACARMGPRTRLLFFSHVLSPTGMVLPAAELCREARRRGILTVVDGAHAPVLVPLDLGQVDADFYAGNCHKWLLAPTGSGFLACRPDAMERLVPLQVSWGWKPAAGSSLDEQDELGSTPRIRRLELEGTRDPSAWLTVPAAIDFQERLGLERIRTRMRELADVARAVIPLPAVTPRHEEMRGGLTAFALPAGVSLPQLRRRLWERDRIEVAIVERPGSLLLRLSTHFYNTRHELERLAAVLPGALEE